MKSIEKLLEIIARLRDPQTGYPWDRDQTFETIAPYTIEEAYEVADAIGREDLEGLRDELGDLLLQVVYHARMAEEAEAFDFNAVVEAICDKMTRRHPHVFGDSSVAGSAAQTEAWETLKDAERQNRDATGVLAEVPVGLPALTRAAKLGRRASRVGFDWPELDGARAKVEEEMAELDEAISTQDEASISAEMGDVLFAMVNVCRHLKLDPEDCLRGANAKFTVRFERVERKVGEAGGDWQAFDLEGLEAFWAEAKAEL
ncbi:MAG: nucleoside triphosphate pyrophosphohydrolase [Candidatus Rariloculaceae bacterium]